MRSPVQIELKGSDMDQLVADSAKVEQIFASTAGLKDIKNSYVKGMPELKVTVDRDKLKYFHATVNDVAQSFNAAIGGRSAGVLANDVQNHGNDTDIAVRFAGGSGYNIEDVRAIPVQTGRGSVFLGDLAYVEEGVGPITIRRVNKERIINIQDAQTLLDVDTHFVSCCCCQCNYWRIADFVYDWADFPVFWPEIMAPFRYTMCLIYGIKRNRYMLQKRNVVVFG